MAIVNKLIFTKKQLKGFARILREARVEAGLTQLDVARLAFSYRRSHCKVSRIERAVMSKVDAIAVDNMAKALGVPTSKLTAIDPEFTNRKKVAEMATRRGFWNYEADLVAM